MKRTITLTLSVEVDASVVDPQASDPTGWDWRFATLEERAATAVADVFAQTFASGRVVRSQAVVGSAFDPSGEPF
jgi:hypothetical protein